MLRNHGNHQIQPNEKQNTKTKTKPRQNKHQTLKCVNRKIIQCHGYKVNYNELLLLIAELNLTAICPQETFQKAVQTKYEKL